MPLASLNPKEIFIGGVPKERTEIIEKSQSKKDFVGCLDDIVVNHVSLFFVNDITQKLHNRVTEIQLQN